MTEQEIINRVEPIINSLTQTAGLELIDISAVLRQRVWTIEVLVDHPKGGIRMDECAMINHQMIEALDVKQVIAEDYELVVASPGLDRPLKTSRDFRRVEGKAVRFVLKEKVQGKGEYSGVVKQVGDETVTITLPKGEVAIPIAKMLKAVQII